MKPGLTLAMFVRNDARRLDRALRSAAPVVSEVVVVDTGSTDDTVSVARSHGARVIEREWPNSFDVALNWALEAVQTEWTLRLDSDEWILPDSIPELRSLMNRPDAFGYTMVREDYSEDGRYSEVLCFRFHRTDPLMRSVGVVHEQFPNSVIDKAAKGRRVYPCGVRIGHDGYLGAPMSEKHRRNLALVEQELKLRPGNLYYEAERVRMLGLLGDPAAAVERERLIDILMAKQNDDAAPSSMVVGPLLQAMESIPDSGLRDQRTDDLVRISRGWFPNESVLAYGAAMIEIRRGRLRAALDHLLDLEAMSEAGTFDRNGFGHPALLQEALWQNLAVVAHQLGRVDIARRNYERLLARDPHHPVAAQNLKLLA